MAVHANHVIVIFMEALVVVSVPQMVLAIVKEGILESNVILFHKIVATPYKYTTMVLWNTHLTRSMAIMSDKRTSSMDGHGTRMMAEVFGGMLKMMFGDLVRPLTKEGIIHLLNWIMMEDVFQIFQIKNGKFTMGHFLGEMLETKS